MIKVGCAGFSIPQTRYFREFMLLEVQETHTGVPGEGTLRRWQREAPDGFVFTMLAPRDAAGFSDSKEWRLHLNGVLGFGKALGVKTLVFLSPPDYAATKVNRAQLRAFFGKLPHKGRTFVWEPPPGWSQTEAAAVGADNDLVVAVDPLASPRFDATRAYFRMPGPAGRRSRYEDGALQQLAACCREVADCTCVFANADMHSDGKRLKQILKL
jgi:uncharacterized protein YecE (DUF72 family)